MLSMRGYVRNRKILKLQTGYQDNIVMNMKDNIKKLERQE